MHVKRLAITAGLLTALVSATLAVGVLSVGAQQPSDPADEIEAFLARLPSEAVVTKVDGLVSFSIPADHPQSGKLGSEFRDLIQRQSSNKDLVSFAPLAECNEALSRRSIENPLAGLYVANITSGINFHRRAPESVDTRNPGCNVGDDVFFYGKATTGYGDIYAWKYNINNGTTTPYISPKNCNSALCDWYAWANADSSQRVVQVQIFWNTLAWIDATMCY